MSYIIFKHLSLTQWSVVAYDSKFKKDFQDFFKCQQNYSSLIND